MYNIFTIRWDTLKINAVLHWNALYILDFSNLFACLVLCWKNDNYKIWRAFILYLTSGRFETIDLMINAPFVYTRNLFELCYSGIFDYLLSFTQPQQLTSAPSEPHLVVTSEATSTNEIASNVSSPITLIILLDY